MNGPQIQFFGNLTRDPEQRFTKNDGIPYAVASVAVNTWHGPDSPQEVAYFRVFLYRRHAENILANALKGQPVFVQGRHGVRTFERQDGSPGFSQEVVAHEFRVLNRAPRDPEAQPRDSASDPSPGQEIAAPEPDRPAEDADDAAEAAGQPEDDDDDLPYED